MSILLVRVWKIKKNVLFASNNTQRIGPGPRRFATFRNKLIFNVSPTPNLEDHPLSAFRGRLFNIIAATLQPGGRLLHPQPEDAPCRGDEGPT
jgi:hypothetical protein